MKRLVVLLFAVAMISGAGASAQTSTPTKEPPAKLIVDPPLPDLLAKGIVWITWRVENVVIGIESGITQIAFPRRTPRRRQALHARGQGGPRALGCVVQRDPPRS